MSIVKSAGGGAALPGTVSLFNRDDVPAGYTPVTGVVVPDFLYAQPRTTLITDPTNIGGIANTADGHWLTDYASDEHVYFLHGTVLRRFNPFTGECVQLASCPWAPTFAVATPSGIYAYASNSTSFAGRLVYHYAAAANAWAQVVTLPSARFNAGAVYVAAEDAVYLLGGSSNAILTSTNTHLSTVVVHKLSSNTIASSQITVPAAPNLRAIAAGPGRVLLWGGPASAALSLLSLSDGTLTPVRSPAVQAASNTATNVNGTVVLFPYDGSGVFTMLPDSAELLPAPSIAGGSGRTPHAYTSSAYASLARPLRGGLILTTTALTGGKLGLTNLSGLDKAPRGKLFFARKD